MSPRQKLIRAARRGTGLRLTADEVRQLAHAEVDSEPRAEARAPRPNLAQLQRQCDEWNARYPAGTPVTLRRDSGAVIQTRTRSKAQISGGHSAVIWLENVTGYYLLSCVEANT